MAAIVPFGQTGQTSQVHHHTPPDQSASHKHGKPDLNAEPVQIAGRTAPYGHDPKSTPLARAIAQQLGI